MTYNDQLYKNIIGYLQEIGMNDLVKYIENINRKSPKDIEKSIMWKEQCFINFPILYLASLYLYDYAKSINCTTFLFATRDCCHWYNIFHHLYPRENAHYFHCSRNMFENGINNPSFKTYVKSITKNIEMTIFIDVHGTGRRMFEYFSVEFGKVPYCFLLSATYKDYDKFPIISQKYYQSGKLITLVFGSRGSPIEMLNYDTIGTLQNYNLKGPVRDKLEYDKNLIQIYHDCIETLLFKIPTPATIKRDKLHVAIKKMFDGILKETPIISKYITHMTSHKKNVYKIDNIFDSINFQNIISKDTHYGVIWNALYNNQECVVKMVMIDLQK